MVLNSLEFLIAVEATFDHDFFVTGKFGVLLAILISVYEVRFVFRGDCLFDIASSLLRYIIARRITSTLYDWQEDGCDSHDCE